MNTNIVKALGAAIISAAVIGTLAAMAFNQTAPGVPDWRRAAWTKIAALDTGSRTDTAKPELLAPEPQADSQTDNNAASDAAVPPESRDVPPPAASGDQGSSGMLRIGDKLRIGFYERMQFDEEKWGRQRPPRNEFQQRPELSGEYVIGDDGALSIPLVGSFPAVKQSVKQLETTLATAAEPVIGRKGFVTIAALERQPVYVLGPVKNPGSYKYAPGMTVLHAVALAGGLERAAAEPWARMEAVRETGKRQAAIDRTTRLMARVAVLKAEYAGSQTETPPQLVELVGVEAARNAIREQQERRRSVQWMQSIRQTAAETAVGNAKREVETLFGAVQPIEENVKLREGRVESLKALKNNNIVANTVLVQAQSELSDVQERRQAALNAVNLAKYRYATSEQELARLRAETHVALEQEISTAEQDIVEAERDIGASEGVLDVVQAGTLLRNASTSESRLGYQIVRQSPQGATTIAAVGTTSLEPGDLVRVVTRSGAGASGRTIDAKLP